MDDDSKMIEYFRPGFGKFDIDNIDPNLCTHGFYGFADLNNQTWKTEPFDPWYDQASNDPNCDEAHCNYDSYRRFVARDTIVPTVFSTMFFLFYTIRSSDLSLHPCYN